jgi:hypothetical protein
VKRRLAVFTLLAGAVWLGTPDRADAQGVFEGGIGYEIPAGTMADYLDGGVDFALLLGYRFQQRYTVSFFGSLSLLNGKTAPTIGGGSLRMPDIDQFRWGLGLDANVLKPSSQAEFLVNGFIGFTTLSVPGTSTVVCNPFCWVTAGVSQTNFSLGAGAQFNYKLNRRVAVGVNAKYFWIFGVDVANTVIDAGSRTLGSIPITGIVRVYQ